ncbi:MAG: DUF262 domain-containing HNH endonuclease family protein [Synergistaceae bacterium]|nr:DUF262 domain-containing HNH endonuclease family protein [Synergistaceae bacterium]
MSGPVKALVVLKEKVGVFLGERQFVIPEYQREYAWDTDACDQLWDDIVEFWRQAGENDEYFLGTIVVSERVVSEREPGRGVWEIVDGQQRITSLLLMLRMFYKKLEDAQLNPDAKAAVAQLLRDMAACIWHTDPDSGKVLDSSRVRIESRAVADDHWKIFVNILSTGSTGEADQNANAKDAKPTDNYSKNYLRFRERCDKLAESEPNWDKLCGLLLRRCIVLPVECPSTDMALTIFSRMSDRGQPLTDSDVFKAYLYGFKKTEGREKDFIEQWKRLSAKCKDAVSNPDDFTINDIFRYYMYVLLARANYRDTTVPGLRPFYTDKNYEHLREPDLMDNIMALAKFWGHVYGSDPDEAEGYSISRRARKYLHCFSCYPVEIWRYAVSVFFINYMRTSYSDEQFCLFLEKLLAFMCCAYLEKHGVSLRGELVKKCADLVGGPDAPKNPTAEVLNTIFAPKIPTDEALRQCSAPSSKLDKVFLLLHAYLNKEQEEQLRPFSIEHILPKKWRQAYSQYWTDADANACMELFGNKVVIEAPLNTKASNGAFEFKRANYYAKAPKKPLPGVDPSKIADVWDLAEQDTRYMQTINGEVIHEWRKEDVYDRDREFIGLITRFLKGEASIPEFKDETSIPA